MSSAASLWTTLITSLKHPTAIAAFASVGMHAALGIALPSLPLFQTGSFLEGEMPPRDQVSMVELSSQDISRLPLSVINPTATLPGELGLDNYPDGLGLPLPQAGQLDGVSRADQLPPPVVSQSPLYNYQQSQSPNQGQTLQDPTLRVRQPKQIQRPPSRLTPNPNNRSRDPQFEIAERGEDFRLRDVENPASLLPGTRAQTGIRALFDNPESTSRRLPEPDLTPREPEVATRSTPPQAPFNALLSDVRERRQDLRSESPETIRAQADENNAQWLARLGNVDPQARTIAGNYPQDACLRRASGTSTYGLIVQPGGAIADLRLIQSGGFPIFNRLARSQVEGLSFPAVSQPTPYRVNVTFTYDPNQCPGLSVPTETETRSTVPTPSASPDLRNRAIDSPPPSEPAIQKKPSPTTSASPTHTEEEEAEATISPATADNVADPFAE